MPNNFPNTPSVNDMFTSNRGITYVWDGIRWKSISSGPLSVSDAFEVSFNNIDSSSPATNVQDAINDIYLQIENLEQDKISFDNNSVVVNNDSITFTIENIQQAQITDSGLSTITITETSSRRFKRNIENISGSLEKVVKMQGVTFDRKDGTNNGESGLIAEDLFEVVPSLVKLDKNGNPESIYYTRIIAYLVEAIKELNEKIDNNNG